MSTSYPTPASKLAQVLSVAGQQSIGPDGVIPLPYELAHDLVRMVAANGSRVEGGSDTTLLADTASGGSTISEYAIDVAAGDVVVAGKHGRFAAASDQVVLGTQDIPSYGLDGAAPVALTADGKSCEFALVALVVNGAVELRGVFGDEDDDGSQDAPTAAEIMTALEAADITNADLTTALILSRVTVKRVATDTITMTQIDPASDAGLAAERAGGRAAGWGSIT